MEQAQHLILGQMLQKNSRFLQTASTAKLLAPYERIKLYEIFQISVMPLVPAPANTVYCFIVYNFGLTNYIVTWKLEPRSQPVESEMLTV